MLFWLTFIQSLPLAATTETAPAPLPIEANSQNSKSTLIAQQTSIQPTLAQIDLGGGVTFFAGVTVALVLLLIISIWAYTRVYVITPNNEAFVRTGGVFIKQKRSLQIAQETEAAKLAQHLEVEAMKAQREREIEEAKARESATIQRTRILQNKSVEEEEIGKKLSVQQSQIEADIALEERSKQLKVAQALQKREAELAEIQRQQNVEAAKLQAQVQIAESERLAKLAQEDVAIAVSNKKRESFVAEAQKAKAESSVITASAVEKAERDKQLSIIAAEREAQERRISDQNVVEIDVYRRKRQAEIAQQAALLEAESIRTLAQANRDKIVAEAEGIAARINAENSISNANLTANIITTIWPELSEKLPEIMQALAPQPGVLGDAIIYAFPGANGNNGNGAGDVNKLLLSTSGLSLINTLLDEGKLGALLGQINQLMRDNGNHSTTETVASSLPAVPPKNLQNTTATKRQTPETPTTKKTVLVATPTTVNQPTEGLETDKNEA